VKSTAAELIGDERIVEWLQQRQNLLEELPDRFGPQLLVIAAGGFGLKDFAVSEP
jgi:hypothetical protein